ncbi:MULTISPECIES: L-arabinose isomerase [unclassified Robiginitalea]|uniref:L-arabinose isomerase n=1 Tax=Robiginitalea TaxID=252306 RepID=UPI00234A9E6F|nr:MULTISPECIES: L-arabinose isomerase [unclassified Robiginitalea]MDC6355681.1 L-arabinose isomerase [Robiginitalea sp. PM2]MDC6376116.1 L-arabinose isomerase [Robiginitalea sp. SP8]
MKPNDKELWLVTGSQHLYGPEALRQVGSDARVIANGLNQTDRLPIPLVFKPVVTTADEITALCREANNDDNCIGVIAWMHTFSPAKMWIRGLGELQKPLCHLHTQFNAGIPWDAIDMDYMNLHQSAHGDREFGFMAARMRRARKVVAGHWKSGSVQEKLGIWARVVLGADALRGMQVARIGDNMREVAVTEGDKVEAQMRFGFSVNGYATSDITRRIADLSETRVAELVKTYEADYTLSPALQQDGGQRQALLEAARIELGLRDFLEEGGFSAFTDTFENLGAFRQLPGIAVQRLMADGFGFGAEGDWKTAALVAAMKVMSAGLEGGTTFMEDYTYHFGSDKSLVLGSHMLEICPSIASGKPLCEIHPLGIGGREDPVRLVFNSPAGPAINTCLIDMGNRFRLVVNEVEAVAPLADLPKLPVARVLWDPKPDLETAATAWILAGGAHHTVYSQALTTDFMEDFAEIFGIELLVIDPATRIRAFKEQIRANETYFHLFRHGM